MTKINALIVSLLVGHLAAAELRADEAAVRKTIATYVEAFNKQDLKTVASLWAANAVYTDRETGERTEGREAITADIGTVFKERPSTRLTGRVDRVRFITPDVASVEGQTSVGAADGEPVLSTFSAIFVNQSGKWLFNSIDESPLPRPATSYEALRNLEWLVGRWVDDSNGVRVDTTFRWTANRAFLLRSFAVQRDGDVAQQGTQIIGWDPRSRQIRSWTFNSDGSFGDATWSKNGDEWLIKTAQTLSDGKAASGTYVLTKLDTNTLTLQIIGREIEGEPQPATPAVKAVARRVTRIRRQRNRTSPEL